MNPDHLVVVLVRPRGPLNIGSICRVMQNFGFSSLRLVSPCKDYLGLEAKKMALDAFFVLESAKVFDTLEQALADVHTAYGTTRRFGKYRKDFLTPPTAVKQIAQSPDDHINALVMGPEDTGLETCELELCQQFITISTHDAYPSMNLSHALCLLLYEAANALESVKQFSDPGTIANPATGKELAAMYEHMRNSLSAIEYLDPQNPDHLLRTFRRIFGHAGLSQRDVRIIRGLMSRIDWIDGQRRKSE